LGLYAAACAVSYLLSGYGGLYSAQQIVYSKRIPEEYHGEEKERKEDEA
jgi:hypothetical protein